MRHYSTVAPTFWTGKTGRMLRGDHKTQLLAIYLITAPAANMVGLFYIPIVTMAHDTGLSEADVRSSLNILQNADGFLDWDDDTETVFIRTMARRQLGILPGEVMKHNDKRRDTVMRYLADVTNDRQLQLFWREYSGVFGGRKGHPADEMPLMMNRNRTGTEQEQEQGVQGGNNKRGDDPPEPPKRKRRKKPETRIPEGWAPKATHAEKAAELGISRKLRSEAEKFIEHAKAHDRTLVNWDAGFTMWLRNAADWGADRERPPEGDPPPAQEELRIPILDTPAEIPEVDFGH